MVSVADVPEILFLNERQVNNLFSYINEGRIKKIVEQSKDSEYRDRTGGWKNILELKYSKETTDEKERETIREQDIVGKFAALHTELENANDILRVTGLTEDIRRGLSEGDFVEVKGTVRTSPLKYLQDRLREIKPFINLFDMPEQANEEDLTIEEIQGLIEQLSSDEELYMLRAPSSELKSDFVFSLGELESQAELQFPSKHTEYTVLGRVEHVYNEDEKKSLMELVDILPDSDRQTGQQRKEILKQMAMSTSELTGRDIRESDFTITYPDVQVKPMAIYLFS